MRNLIRKILKEGKEQMLYTEKDVYDMIENNIKFYWIEDGEITNDGDTIGDGRGDIYYLKLSPSSPYVNICWRYNNRDEDNCAGYGLDAVLHYLNKGKIVPTNFYDDINLDNLYENGEDDFSWVNLPELPKDDSYIEQVKYALKNTEFTVEEKWGAISGEMLIIIGCDLGNLIINPLSYFTPKNVIGMMDGMLNRNLPSWEPVESIYRRLYNILKQIK